MFIKLDAGVYDLLCCPLCKAKVIQGEGCIICNSCCSRYPLRTVNSGTHLEQAYDFRVCPPSYCLSESSKLWGKSQSGYELFHKDVHTHDNLQDYLDEIDNAAAIYTQGFHIKGSVLDVGGHQGRLRHFLLSQEVPLYISIDPFLDVFKNIEHQHNLLAAYPCLSQPCNFLVAMAEELPFINDSFDWVHMRSVVDHFVDPFRAFKEAYRVLKPNGNLMIGLAIMEKLDQTQALHLWAWVKYKFEKEGIKGVVREVQKRFTNFAVEDHHIFRFTNSQLVDLLSVSGFKIEKQHWAKPPFDYCIYMSASVNKDEKRKALLLGGD